jgi:hypothetical protein
MNLLDLSGGGVSLEFQAPEFGAIVRALERFGPVRVRPSATHELLSVGAEEFVLMNDWDEPCLISMTRTGETLLREIAGRRDGAQVAAE